MALSARKAISSDADLLGQLNHQLIRDEGHRNPMSVPELQERMRKWLAAEYAAVLFEKEAELVAYALYREEAESIYLRQLFVRGPCRRQGCGREAMELLLSRFWPAGKRITVEVLCGNSAAISFYRKLGFLDYCLTLEIPASQPRSPSA